MTTYERSYGYRYDEQRGLTTAEIAKKIRADIKQAVKFGLLPGAPVKYSVRTRTYSGGASIDITVKGWADAWVDCQGQTWTEGESHHCTYPWCAASGEFAGLPGATVHQVLSQDASVAKMTLERIHGSYNHDGSDSMTDYFDVNYYGSITFDRP